MRSAEGRELERERERELFSKSCLRCTVCSPRPRPGTQAFFETQAGNQGQLPPRLHQVGCVTRCLSFIPQSSSCSLRCSLSLSPLSSLSHSLSLPSPLVPRFAPTEGRGSLIHRKKGGVGELLLVSRLLHVIHSSSFFFFSFFSSGSLLLRVGLKAKKTSVERFVLVVPRHTKKEQEEERGRQEELRSQNTGQSSLGTRGLCMSFLSERFSPARAFEVSG